MRQKRQLSAEARLRHRTLMSFSQEREQNVDSITGQTNGRNPSLILCSGSLDSTSPNTKIPASQKSHKPMKIYIESFSTGKIYQLCPLNLSYKLQNNSETNHLQTLISIINLYPRPDEVIFALPINR